MIGDWRTLVAAIIAVTTTMCLVQAEREPSDIFSTSLNSNKMMKMALDRMTRQTDGGGLLGDLGGSGGSGNNNKDFNKEAPLTPVNWTEVEHNFTMAVSEDEVLERWTSMEKKMKNGVRSILRSIFPRIVAMSQDAKVSGNCSAGILKWIVSLRHLKTWAVQMLDATGKPSSGILEGSVTMWGNYKQCLNVRVPDEDEDEEFGEDFGDDDETETKPKEPKEFFRGQYCVVEVKPWLPEKPRFYGMQDKIQVLQKETDEVFGELSNLAVFFNFINLRLDLCVPSTCRPDDIQKVATFLAREMEMRAKVLRCEITPYAPEPKAKSQVFTMIVMIIVVMVIVFATLLSWRWETRCLERYSTSIQQARPSIFSSLSIAESFKRLTSVDPEDAETKPLALYGLRTIIIVWIITVHTIAVVNFQFFREMMEIRDLALSFIMQIFTNSSLQFDSLIILTAFSYSYYNLNSGFTQTAKYVLRKWLRFLPSMLFIMGFVIIMPLLYPPGSPVWEDHTKNASLNCQNTSALYNLLFIQNLALHPRDTCLPYSWLFCVELQLALLFIPIVAQLREKESASRQRLIYAVLFLLGAIGFCINFSVTYLKNMPPTLIWTLPDPEQRNDYFAQVLFKPWTHLSVFAIGIAAGYFCRRRQYQFQGGPYGQTVFHIIGWGSSAVAMIALIYSCHSWVNGHLPPAAGAAAYDAFHRVVWSLAFSWIMYCAVCQDEHDKTLLQKALGHPFFVFTGRLSFLAFLIHPVVQILNLGTQSHPLYSGHMAMAYTLIGNIFLSYALSFIVSILIELPFASLLGVHTRRKVAKIADMHAMAGHHNQSRPSQMSNSMSLSLAKGQKPPYPVQSPPPQAGFVTSSSNGDIEMNNKSTVRL